MKTIPVVNGNTASSLSGVLTPWKETDEACNGWRLTSAGIYTAGELEQGAWDPGQFFEETVRAIGQMMSVRDPYTAGHQERVSRISIEIARALDLPVQQIKGIQLAALIHDIGKLAIPCEILSKPGQLSKAEFDMIKTHPSVGYGIIKNIKFPWPIAKIILQHHERINGSGYPDGLAGEEILLETRVLSVADVIEAMSSNRPYRVSLGINAALEEVSRNKNKLYDERVVKACLRLAKSGGFGI